MLTRATIFILVKSRKNTFVPFHTIMNSNTCFGSKIIPSSHYAYILKTSVIVVNMRRCFFLLHTTPYHVKFASVFSTQSLRNVKTHNTPKTGVVRCAACLSGGCIAFCAAMQVTIAAASNKNNSQSL